MYYSTQYHSPLYRNFKAIERTAFRAIVSYYERHEMAIRQLDFDEFFELMTAYTAALFESGEYHKHLCMAQTALELIISENLNSDKDTALYRNILFQKAASHYNLGEYAQSESILRQLIRMNPNDDYTKQFLLKSILGKPRKLLKVTRAIGMLCFIVTLILIFVELLLIRPFFFQLTDEIVIVRSVLLVGTLLIPVAGLLWHRYTCSQKFSHDIQEAILAQRSKLRN